MIEVRSEGVPALSSSALVAADTGRGGVVSVWRSRAARAFGTTRPGLRLRRMRDVARFLGMGNGVRELTPGRT